MSDELLDELDESEDVDDLVAAETFPFATWNDIRYVDSHGAAYSRKDLFSYNVVGLFFSASWSPPCKQFCPLLAESFLKIRAKYGEMSFQVVFVSHCEKQGDFRKYLSTMPWVAVPYQRNECLARLKLTFKVTTIPRLVIIDPSTLRVICHNARGTDWFGSGCDPIEGFDRILRIQADDPRNKNA